MPGPNPAAAATTATASTIWSCVAWTLERIVSTPVERVLILLTVEGELERQGRLPPGGFSGVGGGILACVRRVYSTEGLAGFYRGAVPAFLLALPAGFVDYAARQATLALFHLFLGRNFSERHSTPVVVAVSVSATAVSVALCALYNCPRATVLNNYMADVVGVASANNDDNNDDDGHVDDDDDASNGNDNNIRKNTKIAATGEEGAASGDNSSSGSDASRHAVKQRYTSAWGTLCGIYTDHSVAGFYRGALAAPITGVIFRWWYVLVSPTIMAFVDNGYRYNYDIASILTFPVLIDISGTVISVLSKPIDIISRRMQLTAATASATAATGSSDTNTTTTTNTNNKEKSAAGNDGPYSGLLDCGRSIVAQEGLSGLWAGARLRLIKGTVKAAVSIAFNTFCVWLVYAVQDQAQQQRR